MFWSEVVVEMEGIEKGNVAINDVRNSGTVGGAQEERAGGSDGPNDKAKGKGKGKDESDGSRGVCFNWQKDGTCKDGDKCRYEHASRAGGVQPKTKTQPKPKTQTQTQPQPKAVAGAEELISPLIGLLHNRCVSLRGWPLKPIVES